MSDDFPPTPQPPDGPMPIDAPVLSPAPDQEIYEEGTEADQQPGI